MNSFNFNFETVFHPNPNEELVKCAFDGDQILQILHQMSVSHALDEGQGQHGICLQQQKFGQIQTSLSQNFDTESISSSIFLFSFLLFYYSIGYFLILPKNMYKFCIVGDLPHEDLRLPCTFAAFPAHPAHRSLPLCYRLQQNMHQDHDLTIWLVVL